MSRNGPTDSLDRGVAAVMAEAQRQLLSPEEVCGSTQWASPRRSRIRHSSQSDPDAATAKAYFWFAWQMLHAALDSTRADGESRKEGLL